MTINSFKSYKHLAKELNSGATFVAFDTETTGLSKEKDFMLEIGAVKFNKNGIIGEPFDILIKPPVSINPFITQLTGISDETVENCPNGTFAVEQFLTFVGGTDTFLVAHNANFDMGFVNYQLFRDNRTEIKNPVIDTLMLSRWAYPDFVKESETGVYKLQSLAKRFNINVENAHRAYDDARVCMELFNRIVKDTMSLQKDYQIDTQMELF